MIMGQWYEKQYYICLIKIVTFAYKFHTLNLTTILRQVLFIYISFLMMLIITKFYTLLFYDRLILMAFQPVMGYF